MKLLLNGKWELAGFEDTPLCCELPGSVLSTLLENGRVVDPYFGANEKSVQPIFDKDYDFSRTFLADEALLSCKRILLCCDGLDTFCDITLNGEKIASTNNMHRRYEFDVKPLLKAGENSISLHFASPVKFVEAHPTPFKPFSVLRKAACMFGWDWGIRLPDSGVWRDIYLLGIEEARITDVYIQQKHSRSAVSLDISVENELLCENAQLKMEITAPDGSKVFEKKVAAKEKNHISAKIKEPKLWWPAGSGEQPLYTVKTTLLCGDKTADSKDTQIGLRTVELCRKKDKLGRRYEFIVNGKKIFYKAQNLIIEDAILSRTDKSRTERLVLNCIRSNCNGIRVWGGAYYPSDYFYELCDRCGLLVFHDMMFACSFYYPSKAMLENVHEELEYNLRRMRNHACIGLLCGNNELDLMYTTMTSTEEETVALRRLFGMEKPFDLKTRFIVRSFYKKLFLGEIKSQCKKLVPKTDFVHGSPCIGGKFGASSAFVYQSNGDMHYYLQYNGDAPYQKMREFRFRFVSEIGFQSYPSIKTVNSFAAPEDRKPDSDIMYAHQKCNKGNETIELYMGREYIIPKDFSDYVYLSQLQAGEIMYYTVEEFRRDCEFTRGSIIWQLNDCWPVVSWSSVDYYGRWKAQQYFIKRVYADHICGIYDKGKKVSLWAANESTEELCAALEWSLCTSSGKVIKSGRKNICIPSGESLTAFEIDFSDDVKAGDEGKFFLITKLIKEGKELCRASRLFCPGKEFSFAPSNVTVKMTDEGELIAIDLAADKYTRGVSLDFERADAIFSDNFIELMPGETRRIYIKKDELYGDIEDLESQLVVKTLNELMLKGREDCDE